MKKRLEADVIPQLYTDARCDLASQLRAARLSKNLTQQAVADMAGTKRSNISRMESGKYNPSLDFLVKVADSMGMQLNINIQ